jgi:glyoxylate reductase
MAHIFVTRHIPEIGIRMLEGAGHTVRVSEKDGVLTREELLHALRAEPYDAVVCLLTDQIDGEVFDAVPTAKIFANYAVGFNNIDLAAAATRGITITNTPGVLTNAVAEFTIALMFAISKRISESERYLRAGKYTGWGPELLLGTDIEGKTLGIVGAGRIGYEVARRARLGFNMNIVYYDVHELPELEKDFGATYYRTVDELLPVADIVSIHVPLLPETTHLFNAERIARMKPGAYLINTSRGPVIDEVALVSALKAGTIRGAALDVFEHEPTLAPGLADLENVVITPHVASATETARGEMSHMVADNVIRFLDGATPPNIVKTA